MATTAAPSQPKRARRAPKRKTNLPSADSIRATLDQLEQLLLPTGDGDRMESDWHVMSIPLLDELVRQHLGEPNDYFCGGNMFVIFSIQQAKEIEAYVQAETMRKNPRFKGPDFFLVKGVDGTKPRDSWVVWEEDGKYPDLVVEFISTSTREKDVDKNVHFYRDVFHTPEYFWFDRRKGLLKGYRLVGAQYEEITPNEQGWLWSEQLGAWLGVVEGVYHGRRYSWLRLYDREGQLILTQEEQARQARQVQAQLTAALEQERARREQLEAELQRLRDALRQRGIEIE